MTMLAPCVVCAPATWAGPRGNPRADFQPGMDLLARYTVLAEGARGHL
jgi:flavin-dependent dehydrogenase